MIIKSSKNFIQKNISIREGEEKLGQKVSIADDIKNLANLSEFLKGISAQFIIVGIAEDIGIRANYGKKGSRNAYENFLSYFVNTQVNQFIDTSNLCILGEIYVEDLLKLSDNIDEIDFLRKLTAEVDNRVYPIIEQIVKAGKTPIVIGGGHNNSYGNIKGTSLALNQKIDVLNIDPHADYRIEEGRHSGNGFRYAFNQNYIHKYSVYGLHTQYNNQSILEAFHANENLNYITFDSNLKPSEKIRESGLAVSGFVANLDSKIALEIDLDCIKDMPTSAMTPVGFTEEEILNFINIIQSNKQILYYHFCEASPDETKLYKTGKFLSYLVSQIIKK